MNDTLRKISIMKDISFYNVMVSCIQNSLDEMDLNKYKNIDTYGNTEIQVKNNTMLSLSNNRCCFLTYLCIKNYNFFKENT